jgi:uncharacterized protein YbjT (DUF2867 family)
VVVDFEKLSTYSEYFNVDHVFCCLGTTIKKAKSKDAFLKVDFTYVIESAKLAKAQGVRQFGVVSAMGANSGSRIFYNQVKGKMEQELQNIGFEGLQIFRPSLLIGDRKEVRSGERIGAAVSRVFSFAFVKGLKKYKPIQSKLVAKSMLAHAKDKKKGLQIIESDQMNN